MDCQPLQNIQKKIKTKEDKVLKELTELTESGKTFVPKSVNPNLRNFCPILPELTVTENDILLKADCIILPDSLQMTAIQLAHRGSQPGVNGVERRLHFHFFFHGMQQKVEMFVKTCPDCNTFTEKDL